MQKSASRPQQTASPEPNLLVSTWRVLTHVRVGVALMLLALAGSVAGVLIRQSQSLAYYQADYSDSWCRWIRRLRLDDVYHSTWFNAILGALALVLVCCTWRRFRWRVHHVGFLLAHLSVVAILLAGLLHAHYGASGLLAELPAADQASVRTKAPLMRFAPGQGGRTLCVRRRGPDGHASTALLRLPFEARVRRVSTSLYPPTLYVVDPDSRRTAKRTVEAGMVWRHVLGYDRTIRVTRYLPDYRWRLIETEGTDRPERRDPAVVADWEVRGVEKRRVRLYANDPGRCDYVGRDLWQLRYVRLADGTDRALDQWLAQQRQRDAERLVVRIGDGPDARHHQRRTQWPEPELLPWSATFQPGAVTVRVEAFYPAYDPTRAVQDPELLPSRPAIAVAVVRARDVARRVVLANSDAHFAAPAGDRTQPAVTVRYERPIHFRIFIVQRPGHRDLHVVAFRHQFLAGLDALAIGRQAELRLPGLRGVRLTVRRVLTRPRLVETSASDEPRRPLVGITIESGPQRTSHQAMVDEDADVAFPVPGTPLMVRLMPASPLVREYRTTVDFCDPDTHDVEGTATIRMNQPAYHRGYRFYQWEHRRHVGWDGSVVELTSLRVAWNPALWLAYVGLGLLAVGVAYAVYLQGPVARWESRRHAQPSRLPDPGPDGGEPAGGDAQ